MGRDEDKYRTTFQSFMRVLRFFTSAMFRERNAVSREIPGMSTVEKSPVLGESHTHAVARLPQGQ